MSYLRHYRETQVDVRGIPRDVWIFEFEIHADFEHVAIGLDRKLMEKLITERERNHASPDEDSIIGQTVSAGDSKETDRDPVQLECVRRQMLSLTPDGFERLIKDVLIISGFANVQVTRYSQDGGIDVNALVGEKVWPLRALPVQIQAKRWLHTVGRREVAELRGSLRPYAQGAVVTTSHFSKAALDEAVEAGKRPIVLVDGFEFARVIADSGIILP